MNKITLEFESKEFGQQYLAKQRGRAKILYCVNALRLLMKIIFFALAVRSFFSTDNIADEIPLDEETIEVDESIHVCAVTTTVDDTDTRSEEEKNEEMKLVTLGVLFDIFCFTLITLGLVAIKFNKSFFSRLPLYFITSQFLNRSPDRDSSIER